MGDIEREYAYRPKWTMIVLVAAFFGLCTAVLGTKAANNNRGVIINGVIELSPNGASTFYWVLTAVSAGFVVIATLLAYLRLTLRQRLAFGPTALIIPISVWSQQETEIAYRDILLLSEVTMNGQRFLNVTHIGGKYTVTASKLPSKAAFAEVCEQLANRIRDVHPPRQNTSNQPHGHPN